MNGGGKGTVLVCVTAQPECERLIHAGRNLADKMDYKLELLSVQPTNVDPKNRAADLECLYTLSKAVDASVMIYYNDEPAIVAAAHSKRRQVSHFVTGMPDGFNSRFIEYLHMLVPDTPISMVAKDSTVYTISPSLVPKAVLQFS